MKKIVIISLIVIVIFLGIACAPNLNLVSYPPVAINPIVVEGLQNFKINSQTPNEEYDIAMNGVIKQYNDAISVYQEKLFPTFDLIYRKTQEKDYDEINILITKTRTYNAEWFVSCLALQRAYEKLGEINKKTNNPVIKAKTDQLVDFGMKFVGKMFNAQNTTIKLLNMAEGYDKSRVERNLTYLTKENEQRYNNLYQNLHQSQENINKEGEVLLRFLVELNELLSKGGS